MNVDDRGQRAATSLRNHVEPRLDLDAARRSVAAGSRRRTLRHRAGLGAAGVVVLAAVALVGLNLAASPGTTRQVAKIRTDDGKPGATKRTVDPPASAAQILQSMPTGLTDGKTSYRLPVITRPQLGLHDGDTITVYGKGFTPNSAIGIVQCASEADTADRGVTSCELADPPATYPPGQDPGPMPTVPPNASEEEFNATVLAVGAWTDAGGQWVDAFGRVTYTSADADGNVTFDVKIRRFIDTPDGGRIDCQATAERCLVAVANPINYDESGGSYLDFADSPRFADPSLTLDPAGPFVAGRSVVANSTGLVPGRQYRMEQCRGARCQVLLDGRADAAGTLSSPVTLNATVVDHADGSTADCEDRCVIRVAWIGVKGATSAPSPQPVPIAFADAGPAPSPGPQAPASTSAPGPSGSGSVPPAPQRPRR